MKLQLTAAAATLLMAVCVMPKAAPSTPTDMPAFEIGCSSPNGGESCLMVNEPLPSDYPDCPSSRWVGPCIAPAHDDMDPFFLDSDGSVSLLHFA